MRVIRCSMLNGRVSFVSGCYFLTVKMCGICVVLCQSTQHNVSHCSCQNVVAKVSASGTLPSQLEPRSGSFSGLWCQAWPVDVANVKAGPVYTAAVFVMMMLATRQLYIS